MEVMPSTPCWEGPSQTRRAQPHRGPWETRQSPPQPLPTTTLPPPPPSGMRYRLTKSTHCQWALAGFTAQPSCPLSHPQQHTQFCATDIHWGPWAGAGPTPPLWAPPCSPWSGLDGVGAGSGPVPPPWWPHSLPTSSSKTEQRSENKFLSSDFRHETRSKQLGTRSPTVKLAVWSPCRPRRAPRAPVSSSHLCLHMGTFIKWFPWGPCQATQLEALVLVCF